MKRNNKIAEMQRLVDEGLESGVCTRNEKEISDLARDKAVVSAKGSNL